ncbi:uncharacterized protein METZ01_LOCUS368261, partial [marine metagenome]
VDGPFRNKNLVTGIKQVALTANCYFQLALDHGHKLVRAMDE